MDLDRSYLEMSSNEVWNWNLLEVELSAKMHLGLFAWEQLEITLQGGADRADAAHGLRNLQPAAAGTAGHKKSGE